MIHLLLTHLHGDCGQVYKAGHINIDSVFFLLLVVFVSRVASERVVCSENSFSRIHTCAFCRNVTAHAQVRTLLVQHSLLFGSRRARSTLLLLSFFSVNVKGRYVTPPDKVWTISRMRAVSSTPELRNPLLRYAVTLWQNAQV
jgi:hypothetical protein